MNQPKKKTTPKRRNTPEKQKQYFTKVHEDAIVLYTTTTDRRQRDKLYTELISPAFNEMVDKIVYTYKFITLPNIDDLKSECKVWLTTILNKFNPNKGTKAFSYFSVITKNWFIHKVKRNSKILKREVYVDDIAGEEELLSISIHNPYHELREEQEFIIMLLEEMDTWTALDLKENERKIIEAIKILFETSENIEIFNKKAIYFYIREITGLNTKQVANNLNKIRIKYKALKNIWDCKRNEEI
jgi:hypothetical protein